MSSYDSNFDGWTDIQDVDSDGDGWVDTQYLDTDYDGVFDTAYTDTNRDGWSDTVVADMDEDGYVDATAPLVPDAPVDSVVADVLAGAGSTGQLVESVLADLPTDGSVTISSDTEATLDFLNGNGSMLSGMIDDIESGNDFTDAELDWGSQKINSGGYLDLWDTITDGNNTSNDLRQDQLDDMYEARQRQSEYDDWQQQQEIQEVIDDSEWLEQRNQDDLGL